MPGLPSATSRGQPEPLRGEVFGFGFVGMEQVLRDLAQFPDQAKYREELEQVVRNIDFPPEEALARAGHEVVVIVVPAFAQRKQRQKPVVLAGIRSLVTNGAEQMR